MNNEEVSLSNACFVCQINGLLPKYYLHLLALNSHLASSVMACKLMERITFLFLKASKRRHAPCQFKGEGHVAIP